MTHIHKIGPVNYEIFTTQVVPFVNSSHKSMVIQAYISISQQVNQATIYQFKMSVIISTVIIG